MAQKIVTIHQLSSNPDDLQRELDRLALVTAIVTGNYRDAVQIKRRLVDGEVKPLTEADVAVEVWQRV